MGGEYREVSSHLRTNFPFIDMYYLTFPSNVVTLHFLLR